MKKILMLFVMMAAMLPVSMSAYDFEEGGIYYNVVSDGDANVQQVVVTYRVFETESYQGDVVIPETITHDGKQYTVIGIGNKAFADCSHLTNVTIPSTVQYINDHSFQRTPSLRDIVIPNSVTRLGRCVFWRSGLVSAVIGNSVPMIDEYCFQYCSQLTDVVIGSSVTNLAIKTFFDCPAIKDITCLAPTPPTMYAWYSFDESNYSKATVHVPGSSMEAYKADNYWGMFSKYSSLTKATSLTLDHTLVTLNGGEQLQLNAIVEPGDASSAVQWSTSNSNVATVNANGMVTGMGAGEAVITAATLDGTGLTAQCVVRVYSTNVQNDNVLIVPVIINTESGMSYELPVEMRNAANISALQCDIVLPESIELAQEDGNYLVDLNNERMGASHNINIRQLSSGVVRLMITSMSAEPFNGNDGDLFVLHLNVASGVAEGVYPVVLTDIVMADVNAMTYRAPDVATNIIVKNYIKGDANGDGFVNVGDYVTTANYIMELNPEPFVFSAADIDENERIDVGDLVGITNIIMGEYEPNTEIEPEGEIMLTGSCSNSDDNTCIMTLDMTNEMALTAWQMDVTLPEGMTLQQAALTSRAAGHNLVVNSSENGHVRLLVSSPMNADMLGHQGALLTLELENNSGDDAAVEFDNIVLAERDMTTHKVGAFKVSTDQSGVKEMNAAVRIYAQGEDIVVETPVETTVEIILTNGMSRTVTAKAGVNVYPVGPGIHIVRVAGQVAKLKI